MTLKVRFTSMAIFSGDEKGKMKPIKYNSDILIQPTGQLCAKIGGYKFIPNVLLVVKDMSSFVKSECESKSIIW